MPQQLSVSQAGLSQGASWRDYLEMCKPKVVALMLLCMAVGMYMAAEGPLPPGLLMAALLGVALTAASAAALNHLIDAGVDARMARTRRRPVAQGRVSVFQGGVFVALTGAAGLALLALAVNPVTAWLNLASWIGYGVIYSLYLKRATPQNIVIGGLFGAAPPLFGWTAVTGSIEAGGLLLALIIFAWTPPHFWALALDRLDEYRKVEIPMLPVTHGERYARLHILLYTLLLVIASILPWVIGMSGLLYLLAALALGAGFLYWALVLLCTGNPAAPYATFRYSVLYLALLFMALLLDRQLFPFPANHLTGA